MSNKSLQLVLIFFLYHGVLFAQTSSIKGRIMDEINNTPIAFATISIADPILGTTSDENGFFKLDKMTPGSYTVICSFLGFKTQVVTDVIVTSTKPTILDFYLSEELSQIDEVVVRSSSFKKSIESPLSRSVINAAEIYRNPGGNRDISKVLQILPGVASTLSFRNDIIVRGGAPNENRFYMDGIEIPNINHFATQGSSGGPVGMINVNFIEEVDFYSGAFPANRGNALSSIVEFKQKNGNDEGISGTALIGSSDIGLTLEGPIGTKSTFLLSARRSYLQALFKALKLPFLPTYNDFQYKQLIKLDDKNHITILGLGAIDDFELNTSVNDGVTDEETFNRNQYILGVLPINSQNNYVLGVKWTHFSENSTKNIILSRNNLNNKAIKYKDNTNLQTDLLYDYASSETENKLRFENVRWKNGWKSTYGFGIENAIYTNSTYQKREINGNVGLINFDSNLRFEKFSAFGQWSRSFFSEALKISFGARTDFNNYSDEMNKPFEQFSPRFSASYSLTPKLNANFNVGQFYQLPPYTVMGYRNTNGVLINKENEISYIKSRHLVGGFDYNFNDYARLSVEGFHKTYSNYPFLLNDQISLANLGGDFGVIGNEAVRSTSNGRSYGLELLLQQKFSSKIYGLLSYTWVKSEFEDDLGNYVPSSWDNRHILNITAGKRLKKNWEIGMKFRLLGGAPYTPYDTALSSRQEIWDVSQTGIYDWSKLNQERNPVAHGLDIRVDKKWYFKKWALNLYFDIQNAYNSKIKAPTYIDVRRASDGSPIPSISNPENYEIYEIENDSGTILPSIGFMIDF